MAFNILPIIPTGTPNGVPLVVTGTTSGAANTLHTATADTGKTDVLDISAQNVTASAVVLTVLVGGVTAFAGSIAANSSDSSIPRLRVAAGTVVAAYAATGSAINLTADARRESV